MNPEEQWLWQREKILASLRVFFSLVAIVVIQINPERAARFPILAQFSLYFFLFYSLLVFYLIRQKEDLRKKLGLVTTCLDIFWITLIVISTRGSRSPFFVYYLFPVITSGFRYGIRGAIPVALVGIGLYGFIRFTPFFRRPIGLDTFIIRSTYLFVLAYIFGLLSEFERKQNRTLALLYRTAGETAVQEERRRVARELHDRLIQVLASLRLRLEACRGHLADRDTDLASELQLMERAAGTSIQEIRAFLTGGDNKSPLAPGTLLERLRHELQFLRDGLGMRVILEAEPQFLDLPEETEREVYLVLREALLNVARHAQASELELTLKRTDRELRARIKDNGIGLSPGQGTSRSGQGVTSMRERTANLGGDFTIRTSPGKGTEVSFAVPLDKNKPQA